MARIALTILGVLGAFLWAAAFMRAPGAALEVLLALSPIVVTAWLILMLTMRRHARAGLRGGTTVAVDQAAVLTRNGHRCYVCGREKAATVIARRPARRDEPDPLARFITLCDDCANASPLYQPTPR